MTKIEELTRHQVRYLCFRLQTEAEEGGSPNREDTTLIAFIDEIKQHMEDQDEFGGWKNFAKTWDVDTQSPLVTIIRTNSIQSQWNRVLRKQAKELPTEEPKKFLTNQLSEIVQKKKASIKRRRDDDDV